MGVDMNAIIVRFLLFLVNWLLSDALQALYILLWTSTWTAMDLLEAKRFLGQRNRRLLGD